MHCGDLWQGWSEEQWRRKETESASNSSMGAASEVEMLQARAQFNRRASARARAWWSRWSPSSAPLTTVSLRSNLQCILLKYFFRQFSSQPPLLNMGIYRLNLPEPLRFVCILRSNFLNVILDAGKGGHVSWIALAPPLTELSKGDVQGSHCQNFK